MKLIHTSTVRLPLFMRVVALYVLVGFPAWFGWSLMQPADTTLASASIARPVEIASNKIINPTIGQPSRIQVPRLGIDLAIIDGEYDKAGDSWTLTDDKAQFASMTDLPNDQSGNTFIYGHNTDAVFAKLSALQTGDTVQVATSNGHTFTYTFDGNTIVQPTDTSILKSTPQPRLTLMTCEGILSLTRRVMIFDFKEVS